MPARSQLGQGNVFRVFTAKMARFHTTANIGTRLLRAEGKGPRNNNFTSIHNYTVSALH
jgi:hypothetical protein